MQSKPLKFVQAFQKSPGVSIFVVIDDSDEDNPSNWTLRPLVGETILRVPEESDEWFFILKARQVVTTNDVRECYIDMSMTERITDRAYFIENDKVIVKYLHECEGNVISAVPIDEYGVYDLFYSKIDPEVGIQILRKGLETSDRKSCIAEDLGYILRDEGRTREAIDAFRLSADEDGGPSNDLIYLELMDLYKKLGDSENVERYRKLAGSVIEVEKELEVMRRKMMKESGKQENGTAPNE